MNIIINKNNFTLYISSLNLLYDKYLVHCECINIFLEYCIKNNITILGCEIYDSDFNLNSDEIYDASNIANNADAVNITYQGCYKFCNSFDFDKFVYYFEFVLSQPLTNNL